MFTRIAQFEFRYQLRNPVFWVTYAIFFLLTFGATTVDQIRIGSGGNVHKNSPFAIMQINGIMSLFAIFVLVAFVANVIVRDDDTGYGPIIRSTRVRKFDYLFGRFLGAFGAAALCLTSTSAGILAGSFMPWLDPEVLGPFVLSHYLFGYFIICLPTLFLTGAGFFSVATATRSMMATYLAVVAFLILYLSLAIALDKPEYENLSAYVEPFGLAAFGTATKYWTAADRNNLLPEISGPLLYNRLIWSGAALMFLALAYRLFKFENDVGTSDRKAKPEPANFDRPRPQSGRLPRPVFDRSAVWAQLTAGARIDMGYVFRSPAFAVLMLMGLFNSVPALWIGQEFYDNTAYPVTRACIEALRGSFTLIPLIIAIYYSGELVWRDRDRKMHEIIDSTPVPDWIFVLPKIVAIFLVLLSTLLVSVVAAVAVQLLKGYFNLELSHYITWYVLPQSLSMLNLAVLAIFAQALSPHKYVGWGLMALYLIATLVTSNLGYDHNLYRYNLMPGVPLSDMNGEGQFWIARAWFQTYWSSFAIILGIASYGLWRRGTETRLSPRMKRLPGRLKGGAGLLAAGAGLVFVGCGGFIFYNTNILNTYYSNQDVEAFQAEIEKTLVPFEKTPQPRIVNVELNVDLHPLAARAVTKGQYLIENRTNQPLDEIHLRWDTDLKMVSVDIPASTEVRDFGRLHYRIYKLDVPMAPGEQRTVSFETLAGQVGFRNSGNQSRIVENGTFVNNFEIAPGFGPSDQAYLQDRVKRRKHGLPAERRPPKLEDDTAREFHSLGHDSDWVTAEISVTTEADQTPIAPGYLVSDSTEAGRRTIRYKTESPILNFFSIQSGRYAQARDKAGDIDLTVYYHPQHRYNVERMLTAMKTSLDVFPKVFSPYQFRQARIIEFPGYARFAQSFANTIPYSEAIGFIVNLEADPDGIDFATFVTAHEIGHQWWAHQVVPADMQGSTMLVETFAQYSAMLVMERMYGPEQVRKFLKYELERYLRSRGGEVIEELPLARIENQPYIHYRKGAVAMYFLKDQVGEEAVNRALRRLIARYAFKSAPYPSTKDFLQYLREEAPGHDDLIADIFERITLYDVKVRSAAARRRDDGQFDVTLDVEAKKVYADGKGVETEAALDEQFDVGLFTAEPGKKGFRKSDVVVFTKMAVKSGHQTLTLVSPKPVKFAGVDPYNKRITRNSDTVISKVTAEADAIKGGPASN